MKINTTFDLRELIKMGRARGAMIRAAKDGMQKWALDVHNDILINLTGRKLRVRSGRLRAGQRFPIIISSGMIIRAVFENKVIYAAIHEFGGKTRAHVIEPKDKKVLRFKSGGKWVFAKRVNHPGSRIKEKRYMRDPIDDRMESLKVILAANIAKAADGR
jgi:phage gpG-like protein